MDYHDGKKTEVPVRGGCDGYLFLVKDGKVLIDNSGKFPVIPMASGTERLGFPELEGYALGFLDGVVCRFFPAPDGVEAPEGMDFIGLRKLFGYLDESFYVMAVRAIGVAYWDRANRFCSICGSKTSKHPSILAKQCDVCSFTLFPRISPAVIVLVERGEKILLARAGRFPEGLYSVIAGFVEPGEALEDVVRREIREEVGIEVKDISYFGSQPWPYPDSLMIAFTASWAGGEIVVDGKEIVDARWFTVQDLPKIPDKISIARSLIDWFIAKYR